MKKRTNLRISALLTTVCLLAAFSGSTLLRAGTLTDLGTTAPTPGAFDIYYLPTSGTTGSNLYDNDSTGYGETFTTGANAGGYTLSTVTLEVYHNYENGGGTLAMPFTIENATQTAAIAPAETDTGISGSTLLEHDGQFSGHWIEYTFTTPVALAANTQYSLVLGAYNSGAVNLTGTTANGYLGGAAFQDTNNAGAPGVADIVFDLGVSPTLAAVPEPATWAMMVGGLGLLVIYQRRRRVNL